MLIKFLFSLIGFFIAVGLGICVMLFGWGLVPLSWGWIIGGGIGGSLLATIFGLVE